MKPIFLNDEFANKLYAAACEEVDKKIDPDVVKKKIAEAIKKLKMSDGEFSFKLDFKVEQKFNLKSERRATIRILPDAYAKIVTILMTNDKEVAWHAVTERVSEMEFVVKDILVYPQVVTSVTVDTDDEEYAKWLIAIGEDNFNNLHGQMHSHVNMGVTPSTTDMGHREKIVSQLTCEDYYVFMIWNKSLQWSAGIYDMPSNTLYETADIDVLVEFADGTTAGDLVNDLKEKVVTPKVTYIGTASSATATKKTEKWWEKDKKEVSGAGNGPDDFQSGYYPYYGGYGRGCYDY